MARKEERLFEVICSGLFSHSDVGNIDIGEEVSKEDEVMGGGGGGGEVGSSGRATVGAASEVGGERRDGRAGIGEGGE